MSDEAKCYAATPAATLEQHITDSNVAKNDAEWWAHHEITRLREELNCWHEASNWPEKSPLALREENARLREALKPFGRLFLYPDDLGFEPSEDIRADVDWDEDANDMQTENVFVLRRDIRAARTAIREGG